MILISVETSRPVVQSSDSSKLMCDSLMERFRVLSKSDKALEYGFRVPIEASKYVVLARKEWRSTGYSGSFNIDPGSLAMRKFTFTTDDLLPETSMCEVSTTAD